MPKLRSTTKNQASRSIVCAAWVICSGWLVPGVLGCKGQGSAGGDARASAATTATSASGLGLNPLVAAKDEARVVPKGLYGAIEAVRLDANGQQASPTPSDCFVWPKVCLSGASVFYEGAAAGDVLAARSLDPGSYQLGVSLRKEGSDGQPLWSGSTTVNIAAGQEQTLSVALSTSDGASQLQLDVAIAAPASTRADQSLCPPTLTNSAGCSADDRQFRCAVDVPATGLSLAAAQFEEVACDKAYLYDMLKQQVCDAGISIMESAFAGGFHCEELPSTAFDPGAALLERQLGSTR